MHLNQCHFSLNVFTTFGFIGTAFSAINLVKINSIQQQTNGNSKNIVTLTHISEIQQNHLEHLELDNAEQNKIVLNALRYNPAMLASASHQIMLKSSDIIHKVKSTIQQVQNNKLSTELLRGKQ